MGVLLLTALLLSASADCAGFVDGNKRAVFLAVGLFLAINGYRLHATQVDATLTMLSVAAGNST